jgi:putative transcriptional regulator
MTAKKSKSRKAPRKRYMTDENFELLKESFHQAIQHIKGERTDLRTMVRYLPEPPAPLSSQEVLDIRLRLKLSQSVFARLLNVSAKTVQAWEQGTRTPSDAALKLLSIARKRPEVLME